jgi:WD40 repeat protein
MENNILVIVGDLYSGQINCYDSNKNLVKTLTSFHTERILFLKCLSNGNVISCSNDNTANVWEPRTFTSLCRYTGHTNWVNGVDEIDGDKIVSVSLDKTIHIWSISTGLTLNKIDAGVPVWCVKYLPNLNRIVCGLNGSDENLRIYDCFTGRLEKTLRGGHTNDVRSIDTLNEELIVSGGDDMKVFIWDLRTYSVKFELIGNVGKVGCVKRLSSSQMASSSYGTIIIWNWLTGNQVKRFYGHIVALLYSAFDLYNENTLISCSDFKTLQFWNIPTRQDDAIQSLNAAMHVGALAVVGRVKK